jgi:hypothetical protein
MERHSDRDGITGQTRRRKAGGERSGEEKFGGSAEDLAMKEKGTGIKEELNWHVCGHT